MDAAFNHAAVFVFPADEHHRRIACAGERCDVRGGLIARQRQRDAVAQTADAEEFTRANAKSAGKAERGIEKIKNSG